MYKITKKVPANWDEKKKGKALVVLEDPMGGQSVIAKDDGCYVLFNGSEHAPNQREFRMVKHWYPEAADALARLITEVPEGAAMTLRETGS